MAFATASGSQMADMNVTPLVDVMLVLLIIFMVTVPTIDFANSIDFSRNPPTPVATPEPMKLHIGAGDTLTLDGQAMSMAQLKARFGVEAAKGIVGGTVVPPRQRSLLISVEPEVDYGLVAQTLATAKNQNLVRIGFAD